MVTPNSKIATWKSRTVISNATILPIEDQEWPLRVQPLPVRGRELVPKDRAQQLFRSPSRFGSLPGNGTLAVQNVFNLDVPMIMGTVMFSAMVGVGADLVVDILYRWIDARIQAAQ